MMIGSGKADPSSNMWRCEIPKENIPVGLRNLTSLETIRVVQYVLEPRIIVLL